jgi:hypothetical protein
MGTPRQDARLIIDRACSRNAIKRGGESKSRPKTDVVENSVDAKESH